jgi:anaerobic magnesium-protoporphyrin IX monomethyl ester cyclase
MKVALVVPNFRWVDSDSNALWHYIPYNLCILAACIRDTHEVCIIDAYKEDLTTSQLHHRLHKFQPKVVGITVLMDKYGEAGHIAAMVAKGVGATTVMGGVYASMNADKVIKDPNVDYVITGEGEYTFEYLLANLGNTGKVLQGTRPNDLDIIPLPAYDLIDYEAYANSAERKSVDSPVEYPYARVLTSRGCPFGCCFCQVEHIMGKKFRARSALNVVQEMDWLFHSYGIKSWIFDDDNLLTDRDRALSLFKMMVSCQLNLPWKMIATAAFKLDKEIIKWMRDSGCVYVNIAIESGCDRVLHKIINKPINLDYALEMTRMLQDNGIYVAANFIVGFPTETWDEIRESLAYADKLNADYTKVFAAMPLKHTRLWTMCEETDSFKKDFNGVVQWNKGQIETKDFTADDLTILRAYEWDRINFSDRDKRRRTCKMMGITEEELLLIRKNTLGKVVKALNGE